MIRVGNAINNKKGIFLVRLGGGSAVGCGGLLWRNVGVSGTQPILRVCKPYCTFTAV